MTERRVIVVGSFWRERHTELAYVTRSIAAAASRWATVSVLVPGDVPREPDGAFDLYGTGEGGQSGWPDGLSRDSVVVVDDPTPKITSLLSNVHPRAVFSVSALPPDHDASWQQLHVAARPGVNRPFVNIYIPVNRSAELHRHNGFGFTDYQLVLSGGTESQDDPPPAVAWLTAAFPDNHVIVVQEGVASAWKGRALRGRAPVESRMDLWRLMAHANTCIDLAPGSHIARECVEALRFGTPIVVPRCSGPAVVHAVSGGGATFGDLEELLEAVAATRGDDARSATSRLGRRYADTRHGDPSKFARSLWAVLSETLA